MKTKIIKLLILFNVVMKWGDMVEKELRRNLNCDKKNKYGSVNPCLT